MCATLEKLILDKYLSGRIFYGSAKNHGWPLYISKDENVYVLDSTQENFTDLTKDPNKTFYGTEEIDGKKVGKRFKYIDFLPVDLKAWASLIHILKTNQK